MTKQRTAIMAGANRPDGHGAVPVTLSPCHLVTWSLLIAAGCDLPGRPNPDERPVPANRVHEFGVLYGRHCAGCHGAQGKLGPAPPLNDPMFLAIVPDEELRRVITEGRPVKPGQKSLMPAWAQDRGGPLTAAQVEVLAEGIKKQWGSNRPPARALPPYRTEAGGDKEAGARVFARACAGCHGSQGQGGNDGERPVGAIHRAAFLALISDQALRRLIITGRPDLGMPSFDGRDGRPDDFQPLTSAQIDDLVALLASWRREGQ